MPERKLPPPPPGPGAEPFWEPRKGTHSGPALSDRQRLTSLRNRAVGFPPGKPASQGAFREVGAPGAGGKPAHGLQHHSQKQHLVSNLAVDNEVGPQMTSKWNKKAQKREVGLEAFALPPQTRLVYGS